MLSLTCTISAASGPTKCTPSTLPPSAMLTIFANDLLPFRFERLLFMGLQKVGHIGIANSNCSADVFTVSYVNSDVKMSTFLCSSIASSSVRPTEANGGLLKTTLATAEWSTL